MDKERLTAARKRLKEYQRTKKEQLQDINANKQNHNEKKENKVTDQVEESEAYSTVLFQNQTYPQQNLDQNNMNTTTANSISSHNISNLNSKNNQNSVIDNQFYTAECQTPHNQAFITQTNDEKSLKHEEIVENNFGASSSNFHYYDGQPQSTFENIKDSFSMQKEQMLQMSSAIQDVLKNKNDHVDHDGLYQTTVSNTVDDDKILVDHLQKQVLQYKNQILELQNALVSKDMETQQILSREIGPLQEQLQILTHTTNILVAEKAELTATLNQNKITVQQKSDEVKDLLNKLNESELRIASLEKELTFVRSNNNDVQKACQQLQNRYDDLYNKFSELRKTKEDVELESSELKQKLNVKNTELSNLQQALQEKIALLSLSNLRIQQLTNSPQETQTIDNQTNTAAMYEHQIAQLKETIKSLTDEKSDAGKQYKNYVQQLDDRHIQLTNQLEAANKRISDFENREESYIQRLSDLEQQLQKEKEKIECLTPREDHQARMEVLTKNIDHLVVEQEFLQSALTNKDAEIEQLKQKIQELQESKEQEVDTTKLLSALESEQLGASRAVSQNEQLKTQLEEMHNAFVSLSNDKLNLTEQLQAERSIGKKLNMMLNDVEAQLEEVKKTLVEKETALLEFEKEKLRSIQIEDQIQHYQAQSHHVNTIQQELARALTLIETLKKDNERLNEKINIQSRTMICLEEAPQINLQQIKAGYNAPTSGNEVINIDSNDGNDIRSRKISTETQTSTNVEEDDSFNIPEPLKKLEVKFKQTMEQVADLTDEKQRLEHLVMQLQGETETIGEYIALYQKQRTILHERTREKEKSYKILLEQRNQLQEQLHKLKILVSDLIQNKMKGSYNIPNDQSDTVDNKSIVEEKSLEINQPTNIIESTPDIDLKDKTTSEILDLLTEIKDCNDNCNFETDFHPCPWCSGKLITV